MCRVRGRGGGWRQKKGKRDREKPQGRKRKGREGWRVVPCFSKRIVLTFFWWLIL